MSVFQIEGLTFQPFNNFPDVNGFKKLGKLNVIIGPNNSGKSQLLRKYRDFVKNWNLEKLVPGAKLICTTSSARLSRQFGPSPSIITEHLGEDPIRCIVTILPENRILVDYQIRSRYPTDPSTLERLRSSINWHQVDFGLVMSCHNDRYLRADRDLNPENHQTKVTLSETGSGYTSLALKVLEGDEANDLARYGWQPFERTLLKVLNSVIEPSRPFDRIRSRKKNGLTTLSLNAPDFLDPKNSNSLDLSIEELGSGIKTVLMVVMATILPDGIEESRTPSILYFEELENNLHPAAQTRLAEYLYNHVQTTDDVVFLSTHSQAFVDTLYGRENCEILRVSTSEGHAKTVQVESCLEVRETLDELGQSPSRLLFARGVIWVEGPSDRIYLKAWLDWKTENQLLEGRDYQFGFYGGACLSHYSAGLPDPSLDLISMFSLNPNFFFMADRDTLNPHQPSKPAVRETCESIEALNSEKNSYWITFGPDIENYIPLPILLEELKIEEQYPDLNLSNIDLWGQSGWIFGTAKKSPPSKVALAREIVRHVGTPEWVPVEDWVEELDHLIETIRWWS